MLIIVASDAKLRALYWSDPQLASWPVAIDLTFTICVAMSGFIAECFNLVAKVTLKWTISILMLFVAECFN